MEEAPPEFRSSTMPPFEDYIGFESCDDTVPSTDQIGAAVDSVDAQSTHVIDRRRPLHVKGREFPPLIPSLARTENLHSRMPWVLRRLHTSDGRLILREEKVRHHEYFEAHRSGGRLTLQLVPLEDDGFHLPVVDPETDDIDVNYEEEIREEYEEEAEPSLEKEEDPLTTQCGGGAFRCYGSDDIDVNYEEIREEDEEEAEPPLEKEDEQLTTEYGSGGGDWKCLYSTVSPKSPCFLGVAAVAAAAMGPVLG